MHIHEVITRLPTFQAQVRLKHIAVTTQVQAASLVQARALLQHVYGAENVGAVVAV